MSGEHAQALGDEIHAEHQEKRRHDRIVVEAEPAHEFFEGVLRLVVADIVCDARSIEPAASSVWGFNQTTWSFQPGNGKTADFHPKRPCRRQKKWVYAF